MIHLRGYQDSVLSTIESTENDFHAENLAEEEAGDDAERAEDAQETDCPFGGHFGHVQRHETGGHSWSNNTQVLRLPFCM